jgi:hypothetical protein
MMNPAACHISSFSARNVLPAVDGIAICAEAESFGQM